MSSLGCCARAAFTCCSVEQNLVPSVSLPSIPLHAVSSCSVNESSFINSSFLDASLSKALVSLVLVTSGHCVSKLLPAMHWGGSTWFVVAGQQNAVPADKEREQSLPGFAFCGQMEAH